MTKLFPALLVILLAVSYYFYTEPRVFHNFIKIYAQNGREVHVLFIGNSYTYTNDLPGMLANVASSDPGNKIVFDVKFEAEGGIHLMDAWNKGVALSTLNSRHWDYVVLQEQSEWAMFPNEIQRTYDAGDKFSTAIKKDGAIPVMYLTWMRQPGSVWYTDPKTAYLVSPQTMQSRLDHYTNNLAERIGAAVVPAGDVWGETLSNNPAVKLYAGDGSHPSAEGTYLVALTFYRCLSGHTVTNITYKPDGIDDNTAAYIRNAVEQYTENKLFKSLKYP